MNDWDRYIVLWFYKIASKFTSTVDRGLINDDRLLLVEMGRIFQIIQLPRQFSNIDPSPSSQSKPPSGSFRNF